MPTTQSQINQKAFSLIELSIVLVILGLLTAGIVTGQKLIRQTQLARVIQNIQTFSNAINLFKISYNYFPGDIPNAYDIWGSNCDATAADCNGDGDGVIDWNDKVAARDEEINRAWQHMSLANILDKNYTNDMDVDGFAIAGTTVPKSASPSRNGAPSIWTFSAAHGNLNMGGLNTVVPDCHECLIWAHTDSVSPVDISIIDIKIDDGMRLTGKIQGGIAKTAASSYWSWSTTECYDSGDINLYNLSNTGAGCTMIFDYLGY